MITVRFFPREASFRDGESMLQKFSCFGWKIEKLSNELKMIFGCAVRGEVEAVHSAHHSNWI